MDAKRRMGEAMGRLLTKKPLKCISVEELVRESGVTRANDLLRWKILSIFHGLPPVSFLPGAGM